MTDVIETSEAGPPGLPGSPGPIQISATTPSLLAATSTVGYLPGAEAYVQSLKRTYYLDPTSVAIPDNVTLIAASGGGNWVSLPGVGVIGTSLIGIAIFGEDGSDFGLVAAGQTASVYTLPLPQLSSGEQVTIAAAVDIQSGVTAQAITGATNASPIVLTIPTGTGGYSTNSVVYIAGVLGNTAANGSQTVTIADSTHLSLNGTTGNGAYSSGGIISPLDFGHFERRVTFRECRGRTINAQGGTTDTDLTTPTEPGNAMPSLATATAALGIVSGTVTLSVTAPANVPVKAAVSISYVRRPAAGVGPAPTISSASVGSGPIGGGTQTVLTGLNFTGASSVILDGVAASFVVNNDSTITATSASTSGFGSTGDIAVSTSNGTGTLPNGWTYTADSLVIFGANAHVYKAANVVHSGSSVTIWPDQNATPANATTSGTPTFNAASTNWAPNQPSVTCNGTTDFFAASIPWQNHGSIFGWSIVRSTKSSATQSLVGFLTNATYYETLLTSGPPVQPQHVGMRSALTVATNVLNTNVLIWAFSDDGSVGAGGQSQLSLNGAAPQTVAATGLTIPASTYTACFGAQNPSGSVPFGGEVVEWGICSFASGTAPTSQQLTALHAYATRVYGTP